MPSSTMLAVIAAAVLACTVFKRLSNRNKELPYPPGPKPLPLIGNIRDIPLASPWITYTEWAKTYGRLHVWHSIPLYLFLLLFPIGDIMYASMLGQDMIIVNTVEIATELLDKRSKIYWIDLPSPALTCEWIVT